MRPCTALAIQSVFSRRAQYLEFLATVTRWEWYDTAMKLTEWEGINDPMIAYVYAPSRMINNNDRRFIIVQ